MKKASAGLVAGGFALAIVLSGAGRAHATLEMLDAENSTGFHAPQEATRIAGEAIDFARRG